MDREPELLRIGVAGVVPMRWEMAKSDDSGTLTGWAAVYNVVDQQDDILMPGALRRTLSQWRTSKRVIPLTLDHENTAEGVIGSLAKAEDSGFGLKTTFRFSSTGKAQDARTKAREGHLNGLSIFGPIISKAFETVGGKEIRMLREVGLLSVGLTPVPANSDALVLAAKAITDKPWDGSAARFTPEQWRSACLIDTGEGDVTSKSRYKLPVKEPNGDINRNGVHAAAAALAGGRGGVSGSVEQKTRAARALMRMYGEMNEDPPESLRRMAGATVSASLILPEVWVADMRSALAITSPVAQKAAVDSLVSDMYDAAVGEHSTDKPDVPDMVGDEHADDDESLYALSLIGESGSGGSPPGGDSGDPLAELLASVEAVDTSAELDALAAQLGQQQ